MKEIFEGYLDWCYYDTALYETREETWYSGQRLLDDIENFKDKKVRITIEEIEE